MPRQARLDDWGHARDIMQMAMRKLGYTGASVARFLGMTTSSVNRMARLEEMTELDAMGQVICIYPYVPLNWFESQFAGYKLRRMRRRSSTAFIVSSDTRPILLKRRSLAIDLISSHLMKLRFVKPPSEILIST